MTDWKEKATKGEAFTKIIEDSYKDLGGSILKCSNSGDTTTPTPTPGDRIGDTATSEYPNVAPDLGPYYGFSYKDSSNKTIEINPDWTGENLTKVFVTCPGTSFDGNSYTVHKQAVSAFEKAFSGICKLVKEGVKISNGETCKYSMDDLQGGTAFVARKTTSGAIDIHSYGLAQDWNYSKKYNINGTYYSPYSERDKAKYWDFVNAIGGNEENCKNVNYILWKYAYKDAGFEWGGNSNSYDGKLFSIKYQ
jgi:hypothetical protein